MTIKFKKALVGLILMGLSSSVQAVEKTAAYGTASQDQPEVINLINKEVGKILNNAESKTEKLAPLIEELKDKMRTLEQRLTVIKTVYDNRSSVLESLGRLLTSDPHEILLKEAQKEWQEFTKRGIFVSDSMMQRRSPYIIMKAMKERMKREFNKEHVRQLLGMLGLSGWHQLDFLPEVIDPIIGRIENEEIIVHQKCKPELIYRLSKIKKGQTDYFRTLEEDEFERGMIPYFWDNNPDDILKWLNIDPLRVTADDEEDTYGGFFDKNVAKRDSWAQGVIYGPYFVIRDSSIECMKTYFLEQLFDSQQEVHFYIKMRGPNLGYHTTSVDSTPQGIKFTDSHHDGAPRIMKSADELMEALLASVYGVHQRSSWAPEPGWVKQLRKSLASMYGTMLRDTTAEYYKTTQDLAFFYFFPKNEECTSYEKHIMKDCFSKVVSNQEPSTLSYRPYIFKGAILPDGTWNAWQKYCEQPDREN